MEDQKRHLQRALNLSYFFLKFRPRTKKEVRDYLTKKSAKKTYLTEDIINQTLQRLEELNFINDQDFIGWLVEQRTAHKHKGVLAITQELRRFGVEKELIDQYFAENPQDQEHQAKLALEAKWYRFVSLDKRERFQKAAAFLSRQGFPFDIVKKTIAQMDNTE